MIQLKLYRVIDMKYLLLILFPVFLFAQHQVDELISRVSRKSINTYYSGESGSYYFRQPNTVAFKDSATNHLVWLWTQTNDAYSVTANEYGNQPWSADGKYFLIQQNLSTSAFTKGSGYWEYLWIIQRADGTKKRVMPNSASRVSYHDYYADWSPTKPDILYKFGRNYSGNAGYDPNAIYKVTVTDSNETSSQIVDFIPGNNSTELGSVKDNITADGRYMIGMAWAETQPIYVAHIDTTSPDTVLSYNVPSLDTYWWSTPADQSHFHDEMLVGSRTTGYWLYFLYTTGSWWRTRLWGTDSNAPNHTTDNSSPYDWWEGTEAQKEVQPVNGLTGTAPWTGQAYWSHGTASRWGYWFALSNTEGAGGVGPGTWNVENHSELATAEGLGTQYHAWTGWTDYTFNTTGTTSANKAEIMKYDDATQEYTIFNSLSATASEFTKPGQSPDGTKGVIHSDWLQPTNGQSDIYVIVNYFPYPPNIDSVKGSGGTVTVSVDWDSLESNVFRTYTTIGWPDTTDDPPPPREIAYFRLWRSSDGSTWTRVDTVNYNIFDRYDFADGVYTGDSVWMLTDTPGDGTWYYGVTSVEWSGLESRNLSNVFSITVSSGSGTGSQSSNYPLNPGDLDNPGTSDFYTSFNDSTYTQYVNIYAEDGSSPTISQRNLVGSISINAAVNDTITWVDWLGNTNGTTQYVAAYVDYQGNISNAVAGVSYTHQLSPATAAGQYTIKIPVYSTTGDVISNARNKKCDVVTIQKVAN